MGLFGNIIPWFKRGPALNRQTVAMEQLMKGNALWGANPDTLVTAVTAYHSGNIAQLAKIVDAYERQDDVAATGRMKRDASVARCEHTVLIEEGHEDDPRAQLHRETLQRFWATIRCTSAFNRAERGGIRLLKKQMMSARTHGWSAHNILWHTEGGTLRAEFVQIPMWHFENLTGELRFREHVTDWYGVPLWDGGWLVNSATPIGPAVALACCAKRMSLQDWMLFSERAATPGLLGKTAAAPGTEAWNNLCEMLRRWSRAWTGAVDKDTDITPVNLNTGTPPMPQLVERMDRAIAALYRGADLSTISKGEGLGASLQGEESDMLESDQCAEISEALHEQVDRLVIRYECGDDEPLAYIWIEPVSKPDVESNTKIDNHLAQFGIRLSKRDMLQRYGRAEAADDSDALEPPAQGFGDGQPQPFGALPNERRVAGLLQTAPGAFKNASKNPDGQRAVSGADAPEGVFRAFAEAVSEDAKPLAEQVKKLLELIDAGKDAEAASFAASLSANLASYLPEDPESATVLAEAMAEKYAQAWEAARGGSAASAPSDAGLANSECRAKDPAHCPTHGTPEKKDGGTSGSPSETTEDTDGTKKEEPKNADSGYTAEHRAKIGQSGTAETLGLPAMSEITPDPVIPENDEAEARRRVNEGIKVVTPLGAELTVDSATLKHWRKSKHSEEDIKKRLKHLDGALETLKHPHEIWYDPAGKKNLYVRITELAPGRKVVNAVEDLRPGEEYVSWHVNEHAYDYYREGKLLWLRK